MPLPSREDWMTVQEVADSVGVSLNSIRRWSYAKKFPQPYRFSRKVFRWKRSEVEAFLADGCPRGIESPSYASSVK